MPFFLSPFGNSQFVDTNGNPLSGGKINTYLAGTSTAATTYTTNLGTVAQANPVVLNARGLPANPIWLGNDVSYKFVLTDSADTVLMTVDNLVGINDTTESFTEWIVSGMVATYLTATTFSVPGDQRATLQDNRRLKYVLNSGTYYGYIVSTSFAAAATTVTVAPDATNLDATLSSFSYGFVSATNTSIPQQFVIDAADKVPARSGPTANAVLTNNGTASNWATLSPVQQVLTATSTYTPTTGMIYCIAEMVGGGAGGAVAAASIGGAGGSAGEYRRGVFSAADIGASKAVTIGAGGTAGNAGGTTSLSTLLTAAGGSASGTSQTPAAGGTGGTGTGLSVHGGQGGSGSGAFSGPALIGGHGGASFFGSGGRGGLGNLDAGAAGLAYGSGGGGNGNTGGTYGAAGAGAPGVVIITEFVLTAV